MIELTKISTERAHKLFMTLVKLQLMKAIDSHDKVDDVYNAWRYAEKYECAN